MKLRQALFILIVFSSSIIYFHCDDAGILKVEGVSSDSCINATLSGWVSVSNRYLNAKVNSNGSFIYLLAECPVDINGSFDLCFPPLLDTTLYPSDSIFYTSCGPGTVTFNPPDVKGTKIYNYRVTQGPHSDSNIVGAVDCNSYINSTTLQAGDFDVEYIYVNKDVTVTGFKVCGDDTLRFNGAAVKGWNKIIKHYTRINGTSRTMLYDMIEPPGAVWEYHGN
jgi:hypothetical protein